MNTLSVSRRHTFKQFIETNRFGPLYLVASFYLIISGLTRLVLSLVAIQQGQITASTLFTVLPVGLFYDLITTLYLFLPFALYLFLLPQRLYRSRAHRYFFMGMYCAVLFGLIYLGVVEYFFFDEFNARFNFVAVEYLIYPTEVFTDIWESYPVGKVLVVVAVITALLFWRIRPTLKENLLSDSHWRGRAKVLAAAVLLVLLANATVNITSGHVSDNRVANELALNGIYAFFNAATTNRMDYNEYYLTLPKQEAFARLRKLVAQPNATFIAGAANPIARHISSAGQTKPLNVIVLLQESLGAEFVGAYGDKRGLTPNFDRIAKQSILFSNVYATGTRTVRGMEAVSASFPPVPAESIVKRPHNEGMFNWSTVMSKNGYSPTFIYGGFGSFDNMNYYFGNNGYRVVDRTDMDEPKFANIWGVSDEDAFRNALRIFDEQHRRGEKIFSIIMSTSNHKPFTFPEGVPGVASHGGGRKAGIRYADYAIGKFFDEIKTKPYFNDTVIVVVADHDARVYGKENIPLHTYELPLLIYAPKYFQPQVVNTLTSQIDIAPTVLGLLNISYDSVFFGKDIFASNPLDRFVVLNHNRDIGLYDGHKLTELNFRKTSSSNYYDKENNIQSNAPRDEEQLKNIQSIFQSAYYFYAHGLYRITPVVSASSVETALPAGRNN